MEKSSQPASIDEYIASAPPHVGDKLTKLRSVIADAAPEATEKISYRMPTFHYNGNLVHFAVFPRHIGFYPTPSGIEAFQDDLARYKSAKGSVQFPIDEPLPLDLIRRMVEFRVRENAGRGGRRARGRKRE